MSAYEAARKGLAFRRRHERGVIRATGGDRLEWLNGLLTNDLKPLEEWVAEDYRQVNNRVFTCYVRKGDQ